MSAALAPFLAWALIALAHPALGLTQDAGGASVFAEAKETSEGDQELIKLDVQVRDVTDLGAFEFVLTFSGDVLEVERIEQGTFLGSSGREVFCGDATVDTNALRFACATLGETPRQGAEGEGVVAIVYFSTKAEGQSNIKFTHAQLTTPPGDVIESTWEEGVIDVEHDGGTNWVLYGIIGAAAVAGVVALVAVLAVVLSSRRDGGKAIVPAEGE
jgi:hypothetical protein